jgi:hypothetical protein
MVRVPTHHSRDQGETAMVRVTTHHSRDKYLAISNPSLGPATGESLSVRGWSLKVQVKEVPVREDTHRGVG